MDGTLGSICCHAAVCLPNSSNADLHSGHTELSLVSMGCGFARLPTGAMSDGGGDGDTSGPRAAADPSVMAAQIAPSADEALFAAPAKLLSAGVYLGIRSKYARAYAMNCW